MSVDESTSELHHRATQAPTVAAARQPSASPAHARRILLVEDHEPTRLALAHLLLRRHYDVSSAGSLKEAREHADRKKFDLLISDLGLPDGDGCTLMHELRLRQGLAGIALTGYGMEEDVERCHQAGFATHLIKPVRIQTLEEALTLTLSPGRLPG